MLSPEDSSSTPIEYVLEPLPAGGPLSDYRKKASFDWRRLKVLLESESVLLRAAIRNIGKDISE